MTEAQPARPSRSKAAPQRCHDGCGGMTKGGRFLPGHDAKLKTALHVAVSREGNPAIAELMARGWDKPNAYDIENRPELRTGGQALIEQAGGSDQYIAARVAARYGEETPAQT